MYISSIISKYCDVDNVKQDVKTLNEILSRQGSSLLLDVIAISCRDAAIKFNLNVDEKTNLVNEFKDSLNERL